MNYPDIYKSYVGKDIISVDCLYALEDIFGEAIEQNRDNIFKLISGDCSTEDFRAILKHYYKTKPSFTTYIDSIFLSVDDDKFIREIITPLRTKVAAYMTRVGETYKREGGTLLMITHERIYFTSLLDNHTKFRGWKLENDKSRNIL